MFTIYLAIAYQDLKFTILNEISWKVHFDELTQTIIFYGHLF